MTKNPSADGATLIVGGTEKRGLTRRQVATGALWSVPVIILATSTPAAAASLTGPANAPEEAVFVSTSAMGRFLDDDPDRIRVNPNAKIVSFDVPAEGSGNEADGGFTSGELTFTVAWGIPSKEPVYYNYYLTEEVLGDWTRTSGSLPGNANEGVVTYTHPAILNGFANAVTLPNVRLTPSTGSVLTKQKFRTTLSAPYLSVDVVKNVNAPTDKF